VRHIELTVAPSLATATWFFSQEEKNTRRVWVLVSWYVNGKEHNRPLSHTLDRSCDQQHDRQRPYCAWQL